MLTFFFSFLLNPKCFLGGYISLFIQVVPKLFENTNLCAYLYMCILYTICAYIFANRVVALIIEDMDSHKFENNERFTLTSEILLV